MRSAKYFPIEKVTLVGKYDFASQSTLKKQLLPFIQAGFFGLNIAQAQKTLQKISGVKDVLITRHWPDTVQVRLIEFSPIATFNDKQYVTEDGTVFQPKVFPKRYDRLPNFESDNDSPQQVKKMIQYWDEFKVLLNREKQKSDWPQFVYIFQLKYQNAQWSMILHLKDTQLYIVLGNHFLMKRFSDFLEQLPAVLDSVQNPVKLLINLSYPNGFSAKILQPALKK